MVMKKNQMWLTIIDTNSKNQSFDISLSVAENYCCDENSFRLILILLSTSKQAQYIAPHNNQDTPSDTKIGDGTVNLPSIKKAGPVFDDKGKSTLLVCFFLCVFISRF